MSVESLERAHREESRTPPATSSKATNSKRPTNLESDLKSKLNINELNSGGKQNKTEHKANSNKPPASEGGNKPSYAGAAKSPNKRISQKVQEISLRLIKSNIQIIFLWNMTILRLYPSYFHIIGKARWARIAKQNRKCSYYNA